MTKNDTVRAAAEALLEKLDNITTDEFQRGGERTERVALRLALDAERDVPMKLYDLGVTKQGNCWQVHKNGCRHTTDVGHIIRTFKHISHRVAADSPEDLIRDCLNEHDGQLLEIGYDETYFRIMPCCKDAKG